VHCVSCIILKIIAAHELLYLLQAKQLKDYENAVIAKRLEELDDDEIEALVEEVNKDKF
jgi:Glu-tRNA(Gln) amidotransferase subunit E-like FAD-binding protein